MSEVIKLIRLGELCDSINGLWTGKKPPFKKATVIRNTNFTKNCKLDLSNVAVLDVETKQLQTRTLIPGDLIVEKSGGGPKQAVGRVVYFNEPIGTYSLSNFTSALRLKDSSTASPLYLQHFLYYQYVSGVTESMQSHSTGIRNLNIHQFLDIKVPLPSLEKQLEVVEKLDSAFAEIDLLEANLNFQERYCEELMHSVQQDLFLRKLKVVRIGDVCKLATGGTPSRTRPEYFINGTVKWLVSGDIHQREIYDCAGRITEEAMKKSNTKILPLNSVMIALNGQGKTRGTVALLRTEATCNQSLVSISPNDESELLAEFLFYNLKMRYQELRRMTGDDGDDRRGLNMTLIRNIEIPLMSIENQHEIVKKLDSAFMEIELLKSKFKKEKENVMALRQSLLSSAFTPEESVT
jgi:type I restriction enzyme, S subunit